MKNIKTALLFLFISATASLFAQDDFKKLDSITKDHLYSISFADENIGYIGGANARLLKTVDGGATWNRVDVKRAPWTFSKMDFVEIDFINKDTGTVLVRPFVAGSLSPAIWETLNGGIDWSLIPVNVNMLPECFLFTGYRKGLVGGTAWFQGNMLAQMQPDTWVNVNSMSWAGAYIADIATHSTNEDFSMAVSSDGHVYRTFDNGVVWDTVSTHFIKKINSIIYAEPNWVIGIDSSTSMFYSSDSGKTWRGQLTTFGYPQYQDVSFSSTDSLVFAGVNGFDKGEISYFRSKNILYYQNTPMHLWATACNSKGDAFVVGDSGAIYRRGSSISSINPVKKETLKVYPNPVRDILYFEKEVSSVLVYNLEGKLLKEYSSNDNFINMKEFAPGVYIIIAFEADEAWKTTRVIKR